VADNNEQHVSKNGSQEIVKKAMEEMINNQSSAQIGNQNSGKAQLPVSKQWAHLTPAERAAQIHKNGREFFGRI